MRMVLLFPLAVLLIVGCTHTQLKINTLATSRTWSDIQYQQVADNLAMLAYDPEMLPYFIVIGQGTVEVADSVGFAGELEWEPSARAKRVLGLDLGREAAVEWELAPVVYPERLEWMRAAYLCALGKDDYCSVPLKELKDWYLLTKKEPSDTEKEPSDKSEMDVQQLKQWYFKNEEVTFPWFEPYTGPGQPADAVVVGRYGDTVVGVSKKQMKVMRFLTILILDYATLKFEDEKKEERAREEVFHKTFKGRG